MSYYNKKEFICSVCNASFKKERQLKAHRRDKHGLQDSGTLCPNCEKEMIMDYVGEREQCPSCKWREL